MTVAQETPFKQITADGSTTVFSGNFTILNSGDIAVYENDALVTTGFTVSGVGVSKGATVTYSTAPVSGTVITLLRDMQPIRETDYQNSGDFLAGTVNPDFDRLWYYVQQLQRELDLRVLAFDDTETRSALLNRLPTPNVGSTLQWQADGSLANFNIETALTADNSVIVDSFATALLTDLTGKDYCRTTAHYNGWAGSLTKPKGGALYYRDGTTGTASTAYPGNLGFFDPNGKGYRIAEYFVKASQAGCYGNGTSDDLNLLIAFFENCNRCLVDTGTYLVSDRVIVSSTGSDKKVRFEPGVTIVSSQPAGSADGILYFQDAADGLDIDFNGAVIKYQTAPTARTANTIYVTGATITNCDIRGFDIQNGANMGVAVFCGDAGTTASGSHTIKIHDGTVRNAKGDGCHIENCDHTAEIYNIIAESCEDDIAAITNYTGASGAATKTTPTYNAKVRNITHRGGAASTVSLAGVENFIVENIVTDDLTGGFAVKMTHSSGYDVGNQHGTIDNIVSGGQGKMFAFDTPSGGTAYNRYITVGKAVGSDIGADILSLSNSGTSSDDKLRDITFTDLTLHGDGSGDCRAFLISNTKNVRIEKLSCRNTAIAATATANENFSWDTFAFDDYVATTANGLNVSSNTNVKPGHLLMNAANCTNGLNFTSNVGVQHRGLWTVTGGGTSNYNFGSNTSVSGHFYEESKTTSHGAVTGGTSATVSYLTAVPAGAAKSVQVTVTSVEGLRWGCDTQASASQVTLDWTDSMTGVHSDYLLRVRAA